ncbi:MAG TPA: SCP2 sterol-binding domain-containing protein [Rhodothermales bacterium]|nr:SCP2 sterol-binding domain-containing protein [Rhodothermales bacterium]
MPKFNTIPEVIESYKGRFLPEEAKGVDGVIQLNLTGEGGGSYQMSIQDQTLTITEGQHESPTVTVTVDAGDWLRVNNGETNPMGLLMQGKLKVKGSLPMATKFQTMFRRGGT